MKKRLTGLLICLGLAGCAQAAYAEFGTGFGSGPVSVLFDGMGALDAADGCLEALLMMGVALVIDLIRFGIIHPIVYAIRSDRYVRKLRDIDSMRAADPNFDPEEVSDWVRNLYMRLQREWETEGDLGYQQDNYLGPVAGELGEKILDKNRERLYKLIEKGIGRHSSDIVFRDVSMIGWFEKGEKTVLDMKVKLERAAWYTDRKGGYLDRKEPEIMRVSYTWRLTRPSGAVTAAATACGCGKTVPSLYGECPHCGARLDRPAGAWVLEKIIESENAESTGRKIGEPEGTDAQAPADMNRRKDAGKEPRRLDVYDSLMINDAMHVRTLEGEWGPTRDFLLTPNRRILYQRIEKAEYNEDKRIVIVTLDEQASAPRQYALAFNKKTRKEAKEACKYINQRVRETQKEGR